MFSNSAGQETTEMDFLIDCVTTLTKCAVPTEDVSVPPKNYFVSAIQYFYAIKNGKAEMPSEIETADKLDECIKGSMVKYLLYEKGLQELIQQGKRPVINTEEKFLVEGWNCISIPK